MRRAASMLDKEVIVIGAGLAGISASLTLQSAGCKVHLIESSEIPGGRVASDYIDGFILDRGFQLINARYPELQRLDIMKDIEFTQAERAVEIALENQVAVIGDPRSKFIASLSKESGSISEKLGFIRYLASSSRDEFTVEDELAPLGILYKRVLKPFLSGVFLTDPARVSAVSGKEIIRSFIWGQPGLPTRGVGDLTKRLAAGISRITYQRSVDSLAEFSQNPVIVATDVTTAAQLLDMPSVPKLAGSITWYHEIPINLTTSTLLRVDGLQRGPVINSIAISQLVPSYAPRGRVLLSSTTIDSASESEVRRHLATIWQSSTSEWSLIAKYEIPKSLPIFGKGAHPITSAKIRDGVYVAGDYRTAPSQNGALLAGRLAAEELLLNQGA